MTWSVSWSQVGLVPFEYFKCYCYKETEANSKNDSAPSLESTSWNNSNDSSPPRVYSWDNLWSTKSLLKLVLLEIFACIVGDIHLVINWLSTCTLSYLFITLWDYEIIEIIIMIKQYYQLLKSILTEKFEWQEHGQNLSDKI